MEQITIGFSKPKNRMLPIGSYLIRLFQKTPYSHVYLKFHSANLDRELIYEAVGGGVRFVGQKVWESHAEEVKSYSIDITPENKKILLQYCVDNAGVEYGTIQNLGIFISSVLGLKKNLSEKGKNCSEVVGEILKLEGRIIKKDSNLLTPKDIDKILGP
jgi:hypothetical protein